MWTKKINHNDGRNTRVLTLPQLNIQQTYLHSTSEIQSLLRQNCFTLIPALSQSINISQNYSQAESDQNKLKYAGQVTSEQRQISPAQSQTPLFIVQFDLVLAQMCL